ncbi:MAG: sigma-70 family RNA polymerase sigma factor [Kofleriaceae bacterium]|nr:sigma-70 family RNA polymerase sigma factor [Kofleriaceae bacterium]MCB9573929.1 sigma-70 family RNA polymerase sigma factor [Kofleriaceae bacterium]
MPAAPPSVVDLVIAARRGDGAAFAHLYDRFAAAVHAVVLARVAWQDCADLVQDVFLIAWQRLDAVREPAAFPGWLMTIARNRATDHLRGAGRAPRASADDRVPEPAVAPVPAAEVREALAAIRTLPEAYREILLMRLVEGLAGPEIAERTGLTPGSVRVNLHRGMMLLRDRLGATAAGEDA